MPCARTYTFNLQNAMRSMLTRSSQQTCDAVALCCVSLMNAVIRNVLLVFAALLPIVNPLGMAPIFAEMTLGYDTKYSPHRGHAGCGQRRRCCWSASLFIGSYILQFFGISLAAVQLGGGLVVTVAGWQILNRRGDLKEAPTRRASPAASESCRRLSIRSPCR